MPAYSQPDLTQKTILSIWNQTYRPIEIVIVDDNSPISLAGMIDGFSEYQSSDFRIRYFRNETNLRPYFNWQVAFGKCEGKYLIPTPHDDYFIANDHIENAIRILEENSEIYLVVTNSILEDSLQLMCSLQSENWFMLEGINFIKNSLWGGIHPSYTSTILDREKLLELGYTNYFLEKKDCHYMDVEPDESFIQLILCASAGKVAVSGRVTSIRGTPPDSYSRSKFWHDKGHEGVFLQMMYFIKKNPDDRVNEIMKKIIFKYLLFNRINWKMIHFFNDRYVRNLIFLGYVHNLITKLTPKSLLRKLLYNIKSRILMHETRN